MGRLQHGSSEKNYIWREILQIEGRALAQVLPEGMYTKRYLLLLANVIYVISELCLDPN